MVLLKRKIIIIIEIFFLNLTFLKKQDDVCYFVSIKIENLKIFKRIFLLKDEIIFAPLNCFNFGTVL